MKFWIMAIFFLSGRLQSLCEEIEKEIDCLALSLTGDTYKLFETVLRLNDKKIRVINFKVLGGMMKKKLNDVEYAALIRHIRGESFEDIGQALSMSKSGAARRLQSAIAKCAAVVGALIFTEERLISEYCDIPLIFKTVQRFKNRGKAALMRMVHGT